MAVLFPDGCSLELLCCRLLKAREKVGNLRPRFVSPTTAPQEGEVKLISPQHGDIEQAVGSVEELTRREEDRQRAMQEGLLESYGLEFDKKWIRLLRVIRSQVCFLRRY